MKPVPRATLVLTCVTVVLALPYLVMGAMDVGTGRVRLDVAATLLALAFFLSLRPIRVQANTDLSPSDVAVLAGIVLLPPGAVALVAACGRLLTDLFGRKRPIQIARNAAAVAVATGVAASVYRVVLREASVAVDPAAATIFAGVVAVLTLVGVDILQIVLLQRSLGSLALDVAARQWISRTMRAQLLWSFAAIS